jgi:hypothetical protein
MQFGKLSSDTASIASALQSNEMARARVLLDALNDTLLGQAKSSQTTNRKVEELFEQKENLIQRLKGKAQLRTELLSAEEHERLVARGILLVRRIAHALPPGASLDAVLRDHLTPALDTYRWREARTTRDQAPLPGSRAA